MVLAQFAKRALLGAVTAFVVAVAVLAGASPDTAEGATAGWAQAGTCEWQVSQTTLTVRPENGASSGTLPEWSNPADVPWHASRQSVSAVRFEQGVKALTCAYLLYDMDNLDAGGLDFSGLDTSSVSDFSYLFAGSSSVYRVDLASLGISFASARTFSHMFDGCADLRDVKLSGVNAPRLSDLSYMFNNCANYLRSVSFDGFVTGDLDTIDGLFMGCTSLKTADLAALDTSKATHLSSVFARCNSLVSFDATTVDTSSAKTIASFFNGCRTLKRVDVSGWDTSKVESIGYTFYHCEELSNIDISAWDVSRVKNATSAFEGCVHLESIDLSAFKNSSSLEGEALFRTFCLCSSLRSVDLRDADFSHVTRFEEMFLECASLKRVDARGAGLSSMTNAFRMFQDCTGLEEVDFSEARLDSLIDATQMFTGCSGIARADFSRAYAPKLSNIAQMFYNCRSLQVLNLTGTVLGTVTDAANAFGNCSSLDTLDLSGFTAAGPGVTGLFTGCYVNSYTPMKGYSGDSPYNRPSISKVSFEGLGSQTYTGAYLTPKLVLSIPMGSAFTWGSLWGRELTDGTHYSVSYSANRAVGTAKVAVTGRGVFKGTVTKSFRIVPAGTSLKKLTGKKKAFAVKWKKQATQANGYELRYKVKGASKWKTLKVASSGITGTDVPGLKAKKTYRVQVRVYKVVSGKAYCSAWSKEKTVNVK